MINRKITILGPEGTNLYILLQFILFNIISWFTLFTSVKSIEFDTENILSRQVVFSIIGLLVFFLTTYLSIENLYNLINPLFILSISGSLIVVFLDCKLWLPNETSTSSELDKDFTVEPIAVLKFSRISKKGNWVDSRKSKRVCCNFY